MAMRLLIHLIVPAHGAQRVPRVRRVTRGPQALPGRKATPALRVQPALLALKVTQVPKASRVAKAPLEPLARQAQQVLSARQDHKALKAPLASAQRGRPERCFSRVVSRAQKRTATVPWVHLVPSTPQRKLSQPDKCLCPSKGPLGP